MTQPSSKNAVRILAKLQSEIGPGLMPYWVTPNTVLTLSGARAYCDGVFWGQKSLLHKWEKEIEYSLDELSGVADLVYKKAGITEPRPGEKFAGYDLIAKEGLQYSLAQTSLVTNVTKDKVLKFDDFWKILKILNEDLAADSTINGFGQDELTHFSFGILVGYPDVAIMESMKQYLSKNEFKEAQIDANIIGAKYYSCPQPIYTYPRKLFNDKTIKKHEALWSKVLTEFYESDFHKKLAANNDFKKKAKEIDLYY